MSQDLNLPRKVAELHERETRLANGAGGLTIVTLLLAIVSAMAMPMGFRETTTAVRRAAERNAS